MLGRKVKPTTKMNIFMLIYGGFLVPNGVVVVHTPYDPKVIGSRPVRSEKFPKMKISKKLNISM